MISTSTVRTSTVGLGTALLLMTGCGTHGDRDGHGGGGMGMGGTLMSGSLVSVNGQSEDLSGIRIVVHDTGQVAVTDASGSFVLGSLPSVNPVAVSFITPTTTRANPVSLDLRGGGQAVLHVCVDDDGVSRLSMERSCCSQGDGNWTMAMMRPDVPGPRGSMELGRDPSGRQWMEIKADTLDAGRALRALITNPLTGAVENLGLAVADAAGEAGWSRDNSTRGPLPHSVADLSDLDGCQLDVLDDSNGTRVLTGMVPMAGSMGRCGGGGGRQWMGMMPLTSPTGSMATVRMVRMPSLSLEAIDIVVDPAGISGTVEVWLEDPRSPGALNRVGDLGPTFTNMLQYSCRTRSGDALPYGVSRVGALTSLNLELRLAADGTVIWSGRTPPLGRS